MNDDEEKTTLESGWEEEASTTVEQGEVADKIRAIGRGLEPPRRPNTNITSTNGGSVPDEPTVDDQRAAVALAMLPPPIAARLVITQGNDSGQSLEVRPGKTYTIGRGIDNDLVLTDIAVSRKHFDIRNENGSWVLADRGSGNGTLVNQRIEDAPFTLASGDTIEIGNTAFRFDFPNGLARVQSSYDVSVDDDLELSTVSGKPLREVEVATPHQLVAPLVTPLGPSMVPSATAMAPPGLPASTAVAEPLTRPKTLPPPSPLTRPRTPSSRPPVGYGIERPGPQSQPMSSLAAALSPTMSPMQSVQALPPPPSTTLPLPQMANRAPRPPAALIEPPLSTVPATIPGQGVPVPHHARMPFSYPRASEQQRQLAPNGSRGQQVVVATGMPGRDATSTALVPPMSYANGQPAPAPAPAYGSPPPQLSRRVKMVLAGVGLALLAAVATIAIIKGTSGDGDLAGKATDLPPAKVTPPSKPSIEPIPAPRSVKAAVPTAPDKNKVVPSTKPATDPPATPSPATAKTDKVTTTATTASPPPSSTTTPSPPPSSTTTPSPPPSSTTTPNPPAPPSGVTPAPPSPTTAKTDKVATTTPAPTAPVPPAPAPAAPSPTTTTPAPNPVTPTTANPTTAKNNLATTTPAPMAPDPVTAPKVEPVPAATARNDKRNVKRVPDKRADKRPPTPPRNDVARVEPDRSPKVEVAPTTPKTDKQHGGRSTQDVKNDANVLYRAKRFADAAALVTSALPSFSGGDSQELKAVAAVFSQLGKTYNVGMAPGTKPTDAFVALRKAIAYDRDAGSAYVAEMERVLVTVASKAALSYAAAKEYESAFTAVRTAESLGSQSPTNKAVRDKLEDLAGELLRSATSEQASDPEAAKKKLHQIQGMVDPKSPLYAKATKQLSGL